MSDKRGYFDHFRKNGSWVQRKLTTTPVVDRITRKGRGSNALPIGAWVRREGHGEILGQVWSQADPGNAGYWFVADGESYHCCHESVLEVVDLASSDPELDLSA